MNFKLTKLFKAQKYIVREIEGCFGKLDSQSPWWFYFLDIPLGYMKRQVLQAATAAFGFSDDFPFRIPEFFRIIRNGVCQKKNYEYSRVIPLNICFRWCWIDCDYQKMSQNSKWRPIFKMAAKNAKICHIFIKTLLFNIL